MAETAVSLVIDRLVLLLTEEAHLLRGVRGEVREIKRELESIVAFLKDADRRADVEGNNIGHGIKVWVKELREAAFKIEDATDEYTYLVAQRQHHSQRRFIGFLFRYACFIIEIKRSHNVASKIKEIKQMVEGINRRGKTHGFVGVESARDELIARMDNESPRHSVISLVGMVGLGKTTLVNQIYVHVKGRFGCHAWVEVSQPYNKVELLGNLMKKFCQAREESVPEGTDVMDENMLTEKLRDYLRGKRYFVVFDDIWNISFWGDAKNALPDDNGKGGRLVITTRRVEVANFCKIPSFLHIHELQPLPWRRLRNSSAVRHFVTSLEDIVLPTWNSCLVHMLINVKDYHLQL